MLLGRAYLRESRIEEALEVYLGITKDYPDDTDALSVLANLYRLGGSPSTAAQLYAHVLELNPGSVLATRQLALVQVENREGWEEEDPLSAEAIHRLAGRLRNEEGTVQEEEIRVAADMLEKIIAEDRPADPAGQASDDTQQLMPALIALNIRQARAAGYAELAEALQSLQINLSRQTDEAWAVNPAKDKGVAESRVEDA